MNTCPSCGKMAGLHGSVLQGCICQYSMQAMKEGKDFTISKPWVGLTKKEVHDLFHPDFEIFHQRIETKLKERNT